MDWFYSRVHRTESKGRKDGGGEERREEKRKKERKKENREGNREGQRRRGGIIR